MAQRLAGEHHVQADHDSLEATFELSAQGYIEDVDLVFLADYHLAGKPSEKRRTIFTRSLGSVSSSPRRERVWVTGLPAGYELIETHVFFYTRGQEIPTNLSANAVTIPEEQAIQLLLAGYLRDHRGATRPAEPIWETAPLNFRSRLDPALLPPLAVLQIDADGRVTEIADEAGAPLPVRGFAREVLTTLRFYPALEAGTAVASHRRIEPRALLQ